MAWYTYIGGSPLLASSYYLATAPPACITGVQLCAVFLGTAATVPAQVDLNPQLQNISNALISLTPQPPGGGIMRTVYLKCNC